MSSSRRARRARREAEATIREVKNFIDENPVTSAVVAVAAGALATSIFKMAVQTSAREAPRAEPAPTPASKPPAPSRASGPTRKKKSAARKKKPAVKKKRPAAKSQAKAAARKK